MVHKSGKKMVHKAGKAIYKREPKRTIKFKRTFNV